MRVLFWCLFILQLANAVDDKTDLDLQQLEYKRGYERLKIRYPDADWHEPVKVTPPSAYQFSTDPGPPYTPWRQKVTSRRAVTDADMNDVFADNLLPDITAWSKNGKLEVVNLFTAINTFGGSDPKSTRRLILISNRRLYMPLQRYPNGTLHTANECMAPCNVLMLKMLNQLAVWARGGLLPDSLFLLNAADVAVCRNPNWMQVLAAEQARAERAGLAKPRDAADTFYTCKVPVFSTIKQWAADRDADILIPLLDQASEPWEGPPPADYQPDTDPEGLWPKLLKLTGALNSQPLYTFPWTRKIRKAFFRGRAYCHVRTFPYAQSHCSRLELAAASETAKRMLAAGQDPGPQGLLDVGLVLGYRAGPKHPTQPNLIIPPSGKAPIDAATRFAWLLSLDGITASTRLPKLMAANSPVLVQHSPFILWDSRSIMHGVHVHKFWMHSADDVYGVLSTFNDNYNRTSESAAVISKYQETMALASQHFVFKYHSSSAKVLYWRQALSMYVDLFTDMKQLLQRVAKRGLSELEECEAEAKALVAKAVKDKTATKS